MVTRCSCADHVTGDVDDVMGCVLVRLCVLGTICVCGVGLLSSWGLCAK